MAPEVSGEDLTEGESGYESEAAIHGAWGAPALSHESGRKADGGGKQRGRSAPSPVAPRSSREDGEEQLRLLWALLEAQQGLVHEDGLVREAAAAQSEVAAGAEALQRQVFEVEAELRERGLAGLATPPRRRRQGRREADEGSGSSAEGFRTGRNADGEAVELEELRMQNEALQQSLQRAALERARGSPASKGSGCRGATEVEALEAELLHLRRAEDRRAEEHRACMEDLRDRLRDAEARGREARAWLREGLAEAFAEVEVLDAELQGATRGRILHLQHLQSQEQALEGKVHCAAEELQALEQACSEARSAWSAECCSLEDDGLSQASTAPSSAPTGAHGKPHLGVSIWEELQHTDRDEGDGSDQTAWDSLALRGEIQEGSDRHRQMSQTSNAGRHRRNRKPPASLVAYRCTQIVRRRRPDDGATDMVAPELEGKTVQFWGPAENLDVIGETAGLEERDDRQARFPWERVRTKLAAQQALASSRGSAGGVHSDDAGAKPLPEPMGELGRGLLAAAPQRRPRSDSISSSCSSCSSAGGSAKSRSAPWLSSAPLGPHSCRGVLEWTVRDLETTPGSPCWVGPCLFEVDSEAQGRRALRALSLGLGAVEGPAKDLAIPLLSITAVREDRQDALGLVFIVRYKTGGERIEIQFRAATREARAAWVQGLCDVIQESRCGSAASTAPPPMRDG